MKNDQKNSQDSLKPILVLNRLVKECPLVGHMLQESLRKTTDGTPKSQEDITSKEH